MFLSVSLSAYVSLLAFALLIVWLCYSSLISLLLFSFYGVLLVLHECGIPFHADFDHLNILYLDFLLPFLLASSSSSFASDAFPQHSRSDYSFHLDKLQMNRSTLPSHPQASRKLSKLTTKSVSTTDTNADGTGSRQIRNWRRVCRSLFSSLP